ncbi:MAG: hypothetical protein ISN29_00235 [Gammaproteobacteria bacterium AqS3]|nr:hypothetical protein [Gammaproteobacteria bacterium AqS3]
MEEFSYTDIAAWVGVFIATISLAWNIYAEYRKRDRLRIEIRPNMGSWNNDEPLPDGTIFAALGITIVNKSGLPTTILKVSCYTYTNYFMKIFDKPLHKKALGLWLMDGDFSSNTVQGELSCNLASGTFMRLMMFQQNFWRLLEPHDISKLYIYIAVEHTASKKVQKVRLKLDI